MVHLSFKDTTYPPPPPPVLLLDRLLPLVLRGRHLPSFFCFTNSKTFRETKTEVCKCSADSGLRMPNSENLASASKIIIYAIPPFFNFKVICQQENHSYKRKTLLNQESQVVFVISLIHKSVYAIADKIYCNTRALTWNDDFLQQRKATSFVGRGQCTCLPSSNPAEDYSYFCEMLFEKKENKRRQFGVGPRLLRNETTQLSICVVCQWRYHAVTFCITLCVCLIHMRRRHILTTYIGQVC